MSTRDPNCSLCQQDGGALLWHDSHLRIIEVIDNADYPGFTRVVWQAHIAEMTGLSSHGRDLLMRAVYIVEQAQQEVLKPDKINLASLGNMVPHLHWHVIPRWREDRCFPDPIWAPPAARSDTQIALWETRQDELRAVLPHYRSRLLELINTLLW